MRWETIGDGGGSDERRAAVVELEHGIHDGCVLRLGLLRRPVQPHHRRADQLSLPSQVARQQVEIVVPSTEKVVGLVGHAALQHKLILDLNKIINVVKK